MADDKSKGAYRLFYISGMEKRAGATFDTLDAALAAARASDEPCDILGPDDKWYAREQTVGIDLRKIDDSSESARAIAKNTDEVVAWMESRPSRSSKKS
jgi:hypothetical protein